jgi:mRNA degradation ribonuclease J1/J2
LANHFGVKIDRTHVSGHASGLQLKEFVQEVNAKNLIPIHTENAKGFEGCLKTSPYWEKLETTILSKLAVK